MKTIERVLLFGAGLLLSLNFLHAAPTLLSAQSVPVGELESSQVQSIGEVQTAPPDSIVQLTAEAQGLARVAPADLPKYGTFWLVMPGIGGMAPLPCPPDDPSLPVFQIADDQFLVDETGGQVVVNPRPSKLPANRSTVAAALTAQADAVVNLISQVQEAQFNQEMDALFGMDDAEMTADASSMSVDYGTNLYIAQVNITNGYLAGIGSNTEADIQYEIQSKENLLQSDWLSEGFILGSEITNWTPLSVTQGSRTNLFIRLRSWADDGSGLPIWWQLQYFGTNGVDPYGNPAGDGWSNLQKFQNGWNPNQFYTPAAPQGLTVNLNQSSQTAAINWLPSSGAVTGYTVEKSYQPYSYSSPQISDSNTTATSYHDSIANNNPDPWSGNTYDVTYRVQAHYSTGGSSGWSPPMPLQPTTISGTIVPGANGATTLAVSGVPANAATVRLVFIDQSALGHGNTSFNYSEDIPVSSFTNGLYSLPAAWQPPRTDAYGNANYAAYVESVDANGNASSASLLGSDAWNLPFYDGRVQLKQNLTFQFRITDTVTPFGFDSYRYDPYTGYSNPTYAVTPTNYVYAGFYDINNTNGIYGTARDWPVLNIYRPFEDNYLYRNFVFTSADADANGNMTTGVKYSANFDEFFNLSLQLPPAYQPTANVSGSVPLLNTSTTRWLCSYPLDFDPATVDLSYNLEFVGLSCSLDSSDDNALLLAFNSNARNYWGLPYSSARIFYADAQSSKNTILYPGNSLSIWWLYAIFPETAQPQFQTVEYDFWNGGRTNIPGNSAFSPTNKSDVIMVGAGQSVGLAAYAKLAVQNGYSGVYGYLQQYLDKAYKIDGNGNVTTNLTGVVSPYGNYFATEVGAAAVVTMPDVDTGQRGTCTVYSVALQLDVNHDGNMNLSFNGTDRAGFTFWCNNNYDRRFKDADDNTYYEDDIKIAATPDCNYADDYGHRLIPTKRDLQDFTRLWICGVTSNLLAVLPIGSSVTLSWGDVGSPNSGNPTIDLFAAADADGGIGYLTNATVAAQQTNISASAYIGRLGPGTSLQLNSLMNQLPTTHFIWCGASNGTGGLMLTIKDASGNTLAQTTAYIQIKDIKQMYERWTVGDEPSKAPTNTAYLAAESLPVGAPKFQYPQPQDTNTSYILYVHGWNMETWEKDRFAESAFKRLYWQGYQGRFGSFRWPTDYGFGTFKLKNPATDPRNFDNSEFNAWRSGIGLTYLLTDLYNEYGNHVYVLAHSMGNIVTSEALRYAGTNQIVNTYVASQGAISAHTYDDSLPDSLFSSSSPKTPNIYNNWFAGNNGGGAGRVINFYNTNDFALAIGRWGLDQQLKPDQSITTLGTSYNFDGYPYTGLPHYTPGSVDDTPPWMHFERNVFYTTNYFNMNIIADRYEVSAYAAQARATALGRIAAVHNVAANVKLTTVWPTDSSGHNYGDHFWHSAQFRGDCSQEWNYWNALLFSQPLGFNINNQ